MPDSDYSDYSPDQYYGGAKPVKGVIPDKLRPWIEAQKEASQRMLQKYGSKEKVPTGATRAEAQKIYYQQQGHVRKERQSPSARSKRLHGLSPRKLHQPVTKSEAVDLYLKGYERQAHEGHRVNPSGKRVYREKYFDKYSPTSGSPGEPIPTRTEKDFEHPGYALRRRMINTAKRGSPTKSRKMLKICPDGVKTQKDAEEKGCQDSWRLRRNRAWNRYQVDDVSSFSSVEEARKSPLFRQAKKLVGPSGKMKRDASHLVPYQRRKGEKKEDWKERIASLKKESHQEETTDVTDSSPPAGPSKRPKHRRSPEARQRRQDRKDEAEGWILPKHRRAERD
jgi:hypothetical protein